MTTGGWQPIETAPKEPSKIVWVGYPYCIRLAWWDERTRIWTDYERNRGLTFAPTHWQPIPKPPGRALGEEQSR